jgi:hypothetical protein
MSGKNVVSERDRDREGSVNGKATDGSYKRRRETRKNGFYMRMTDAELHDLDLLSYECEESKSDIMRKAYQMYADLRRNQL